MINKVLERLENKEKSGELVGCKAHLWARGVDFKDTEIYAPGKTFDGNSSRKWPPNKPDTKQA